MALTEGGGGGGGGGFAPKHPILDPPLYTYIHTDAKTEVKTQVIFLKSHMVDAKTTVAGKQLH